MLKVVFDSNVYIGAFVISGSKSEEVFLLAFQGKFQLFTSPTIVSKTANKLREKFNASETDVQRFVRQIGKVATVIKPKARMHILLDDPDNRVLECALATKADLIVTGDKHLLKLKNYQGIGVVRVADLLYTVREK